jgi:hypothetical protein
MPRKLASRTIWLAAPRHCRANQSVRIAILALPSSMLFRRCLLLVRAWIGVACRLVTRVDLNQHRRRLNVACEKFHHPRADRLGLRVQHLIHPDLEHLCGAQRPHGGKFCDQLSLNLLLVRLNGWTLHRGEVSRLTEASFFAGDRDGQTFRLPRIDGSAKLLGHADEAGRLRGEFCQTGNLPAFSRWPDARRGRLALCCDGLRAECLKKRKISNSGREREG